jgi:hypothetical protein
MKSLKRLATQPIRAPRPRVLARFAAAFIVAVLAWFLLRDPLVGLHMRFANRILQKSGYETAQLAVKDGELCLRVRKPVVSESESSYRYYPRGNKYGITWNSLFFMCLLLCVPLRVAKKRWWYLLIVALIFFGLDSFPLILSAVKHPAVGSISGEITRAGEVAAWMLRVLNMHRVLFLTMICLLFLPLFVDEPQSHASTP